MSSRAARIAMCTFAVLLLIWPILRFVRILPLQLSSSVRVTVVSVPYLLPTPPSQSVAMEDWTFRIPVEWSAANVGNAVLIKAPTMSILVEAPEPVRVHDESFAFVRAALLAESPGFGRAFLMRDGQLGEIEKLIRWRNWDSRNQFGAVHLKGMGWDAIIRREVRPDGLFGVYWLHGETELRHKMVIRTVPQSTRVPDNWTDHMDVLQELFQVYRVEREEVRPKR